MINVGSAQVHPSGAIEVEYKDRAERNHSVYINDQSIDILRKAFTYEAQYNIPLGHAFWHAENPLAEIPCDTCKRQS
jgi:hypothetical protein